jgi:signal transduction histidine kinase
VRRIVYGLRPPVLDEVGLVGALRRQEGQLGRLALDVDAPGDLPVLPAAVEVAAYRVASEAVTNVARHARATHAVVSLRAEPDCLRLVVTDDGRADAGWTAGVGLRSMEERVAEVGGRFVAGPTPTGGRVEAVLPLLGER